MECGPVSCGEAINGVPEAVQSRGDIVEYVLNFLCICKAVAVG